MTRKQRYNWKRDHMPKKKEGGHIVDDLLALLRLVLLDDDRAFPQVAR